MDKKMREVHIFWQASIFFAEWHTIKKPYFATFQQEAEHSLRDHFRGKFPIFHASCTYVLTFTTRMCGVQGCMIECEELFDGEFHIQSRVRMCIFWGHQLLDQRPLIPVILLCYHVARFLSKYCDELLLWSGQKIASMPGEKRAHPPSTLG